MVFSYNGILYRKTIKECATYIHNNVPKLQKKKKKIILNERKPSIRKYEFLEQEKLHTTIEIRTMVVSEGCDRLEEGM